MARTAECRERGLVPFQLVLANLLSHAVRLGGRLDGALM